LGIIEGTIWLTLGYGEGMLYLHWQDCFGEIVGFGIGFFSDSFNMWSWILEPEVAI
jgi:hypothetical protein